MIDTASAATGAQTESDAGGDAPILVKAPEELHKIVIVGGGAGGLELATRLGDKLGRKKKAHITLCDKTRTHIWKPLLHEIAAGSMDVSRHELDYLAQAHWHGFRYRYGEMIGVDRDKKLVHLAATYDEDGRQITPERLIRYDTLVIAIGSICSDFGVPGVKEHAIVLDTHEQAEKFNRQLVNACLRAYTQQKPLEPGQLQVAIIGAGATGSELSAELHRTARGVIAFGMETIDADQDIKITLIEAAPRILPALPERLSKATADILTGLGVDLRTNARVTDVQNDGIVLHSGDFVPAELTVWAAGVKGPDVLSNLGGLELSPSDQLVIKPTLQTTKDDDIFVIGDAGYLVPKNAKEPIPPRAQAAHQQSSHLITNLQRRLDGRDLRPFKYRDFGSLVSLGHYTVVGSLMGFISGRSMWVEGLLAKLMYRSLYKMHLVALHGFWKTSLDTLGRLLTRRTEPHVKLH